MSGEWVATIACDPSDGICASNAIRPRHDVKESAASGSSNRYRPGSTTRVLSTWRKACPWLRACRSTPPKRSAHSPSAPIAVKSSSIFSARRKNPPLPPPRVPNNRSARSRFESSSDGRAVAASETLRRCAPTCRDQAEAIASTRVDLPLPFSPMSTVSPGAGSKPFSTSSRTAGIVKGQSSVRTFPRSTSMRRKGAPVSVVIGRIFSGKRLT